MGQILQALRHHPLKTTPPIGEWPKDKPSVDLLNIETTGHWSVTKQAQ